MRMVVSMSPLLPGLDGAETWASLGPPFWRKVLTGG